jgi:3-oxoacyl-[acyl-carrier protein] reductase
VIELNNKTVFITGGSRGIGKAIALSFAANGANVAINYQTNSDAAKAVVTEIKSMGCKAIALKGDIANKESVLQMRDQVLARFETVDILVNNAGINLDNTLLEMEEEQWDRVLDVNLKGPFLCSQVFAKLMVENRSGKIVNISAITGAKARLNAPNYCSSKAGLNMLTKCMALELAPNVQVNGIGVGFIESKLVREIYSQAQIDAANAVTPLNRMGTKDEIAQMALYLASSGSDFMTGQTIALDGGKIIG